MGSAARATSVGGVPVVMLSAEPATANLSTLHLGLAATAGTRWRQYHAASADASLTTLRIERCAAMTTRLRPSAFAR